MRTSEIAAVDGRASTLHHLGTLRLFLHRRDVTGVGARYGFDVRRLRDGVVALAPADAADLAERVRLAEDDLARLDGEPRDGDARMVPTTAIILALLVIILVVVG